MHRHTDVATRQALGEMPHEMAQRRGIVSRVGWRCAYKKRARRPKKERRLGRIQFVGNRAGWNSVRPKSRDFPRALSRARATPRAFGRCELSGGIPSESDGI